MVVVAIVVLVFTVVFQHACRVSFDACSLSGKGVYMSQAPGPATSLNKMKKRHCLGATQHFIHRPVDQSVFPRTGIQVPELITHIGM